MNSTTNQIDFLEVDALYGWSAEKVLTYLSDCAFVGVKTKTSNNIFSLFYNKNKWGNTREINKFYGILKGFEYGSTEDEELLEKAHEKARNQAQEEIEKKKQEEILKNQGKEAKEKAIEFGFNFQESSEYSGYFLLKNSNRNREAYKKLTGIDYSKEDSFLTLYFLDVLKTEEVIEEKEEEIVVVKVCVGRKEFMKEAWIEAKKLGLKRLSKDCFKKIKYSKFF